MKQPINQEWMEELEKMDRKSNVNKQDGDKQKIDWLQVNKAFKTRLTFKVMPANSKENNIWAYVVGTHWDLGSDGMRFVCPEQTIHLRKNGVVCPICEAKRRLEAMGFTKEELSKEGKFGRVPVFEPRITSNIKVVALSSDLQEFDKKHVSILQQNSIVTAKWLLKQYQDPNTPDFLEVGKSNVVSFSRTKENGSWERNVTFATQEFAQDVVVKLKEENEELTMSELWKMPTDEEIMKAKEIADAMVESYIASRKAINEASQVSADDNIPF